MDINIDEEIEDLKKNKVIDGISWDLFNKLDYSKKREKMLEEYDTEYVNKINQVFKSPTYQNYMEYQFFKNMKSSKVDNMIIDEKPVAYAKIEIEFTTEFEQFKQGEYIMKEKFLEIGVNKKGSTKNYLDLSNHISLRPTTGNYISEKHFSIIYDSKLKRFTLLNHCKNGVLVDYFLVVDDPYYFVKKVHEIRLGQLFINVVPCSFNLYSINLKFHSYV